MRKHITLYLALTVCLLATNSSVDADGGSGAGDVPILDGAPIVQNFDSLSGTASPSNALPPGWYLKESGTGSAADGNYVVGTGSSNSGGAYSFGSTTADRALGSLGSGSVSQITYGARLTNNGSGPMTALAISFEGEMWRRGNTVVPSADVLTFAYSTTASDLTVGSFTNVAELNFASPGNACASVVGATNGNGGGCNVPVGAVLTGLSVNPGQSMWIRWTDTDSPSGDDGLAIDNVSVAATFSSDPTPPNTSGLASPSTVSPGAEITLSGTILPGYNPLSQSYTVTCDLTPIGGASNQVLPDDGTAFSYTTSVSSDAPLGAKSLACSIEDDQGRATSFSIGLTVLLPLDSTCHAAATPISSIQGPGPLSPLTGHTVDVEAIVVGDLQGSNQLSGFYIEEPAAEQDANVLTSEGLFVFSPLPAALGDRVRVRGVVAEFSSSTGSAVSSLTELSSVSTVQVCSSNEPLPLPVDVTLPVDELSQFERYEGMLVGVNQQLVVTGTFNLGRFGQIDLAPSVLYQPTQTAGNAASWAASADLIARSRIALDDGSNDANTNLNGGTVAPYPAPGLSNANTLRVGALVNANGDDPPTPLVGIFDDRFGAYRLHPAEAVTFSNAPNPRPDAAAVAAAAGARFRIVSANVFNFFTTLGSRGAATLEELANQREKLTAALTRTGGDVIGVSELQNFENGQTNGGTYTNAAIADLTAALAAATGRNYQYLDTIDQANLAPGNLVADNGTDAIRSGIIYDAGTVTPVGPAALYYQNDQNRPSIAQTFRPASVVSADQQTFTVVVNHFRSKGSACGVGNDDPHQGNCNGMRTSMANNVASWLGVNPTADPAGVDRKYILIGDFNAYFGEDPIQALLGSGGYTNLVNVLLGEDAYSYNFGSQRGYLDHALANAAALPLVKSLAHLHINADEPAALQALDTNLKSAPAQAAYYAPNEFAAADHDPIVIGFNPLLGDFDDDGQLDADDRTALLLVAQQTPGSDSLADRRMDMNQDGVIGQDDFHVWQNSFIGWKEPPGRSR